MARAMPRVNPFSSASSSQSFIRSASIVCTSSSCGLDGSSDTSNPLCASTSRIHSRKDRLISCCPRSRQPVDQGIHRPLQVRRRAAVLQPHHRRHQVAPRQIVIPATPSVKHEVPLRGLIPRQVASHRRDQLRHVDRRRPGPAPVVEHHGQHRWQPAVRAHGSAPDEVLIQQPRVDEDAQRHVPVHGGLELEQHQHVEPLVAESHPPRPVAAAPAQVLAHELRGQLLERGEVERIAPPRGGEPAEQVFDHPGMGEQELAGGVVHARTVSPHAASRHGPRARRCMGERRDVCTPGRRAPGLSLQVPAAGGERRAGHVPARHHAGRDPPWTRTPRQSQGRRP